MPPVMSEYRRRFLRRSAAAGIGVVAPAMYLRTVQAMESVQVGDGELSIFSDGNMFLPRSFVFPDSLDQVELKALLSQYGLDNESLTPDCNITLWRRGEHLVLFDVGAGPHFLPDTGDLLDNLLDADVDPEDITDVVFTHAHPDHLWGLLDDFDELICPNATYHMNAIEWDYWQAADTLDKTPEERKTFVVGAQNRLPIIEPVIQLFSPGEEILPGIEAVETYGHTPGHTAFILHAGNNENVMVVGDALTNIAVSFEKPGWHLGSDQDPETAAAMRVKLLDRLAGDEIRIVGYHLPHPGLGRVEKKDNSYRFTQS